MNEVLRQEKKFLMNVIDCERLCGILNQVMIKDPHNGVQGYRIRSLYFDTPAETDYYDKLEGIELRRKVRLRIYDPSADFAMLELKQKEGQYQRKRSLRIRRHDAQELIKGRYECLLKYSEPFAAECFGIMHGKCYRPKTVVEYKRRAFIARENRIRVTMDTGIVATELNYDLFSPDLNMYPVLDKFNGVLEVKYNGFMLTYIKNLTEMVDRSELSVSKYCLARSAGLKFGI